MNTSSQFKKVLLTSTIIFALIMLSGCNDGSDNNSSQAVSNQSTVEENKPEAPKIDIHAAIMSDNIGALKQHILTESDINQKDPFGGSSPLMSAVLFDKKEMATLLIDAGAELNLQNNDGSTALHTAAFFCRTEMVKLLLESGIDQTIKNNSESTAYDSVAGAFNDVKPRICIFPKT